MVENQPKTSANINPFPVSFPERTWICVGVRILRGRALFTQKPSPLHSLARLGFLRFPPRVAFLAGSITGQVREEIEER
jgi:hypothetical protein